MKAVTHSAKPTSQTGGRILRSLVPSGLRPDPGPGVVTMQRSLKPDIPQPFTPHRKKKINGLCITEKQWRAFSRRKEKKLPSVSVLQDSQTSPPALCGHCRTRITQSMCPSPDNLWTEPKSLRPANFSHTLSPQIYRTGPILFPVIDTCPDVVVAFGLWLQVCFREWDLFLLQIQSWFQKSLRVNHFEIEANMNFLAKLERQTVEMIKSFGTGFDLACNKDVQNSGTKECCDGNIKWWDLVGVETASIFSFIKQQHFFRSGWFSSNTKSLCQQALTIYSSMVQSRGVHPQLYPPAVLVLNQLSLPAPFYSI